jgi:hypothetical protein
VIVLDNGTESHTVVITMEKIEFASMQPIVREILSTVRFEPRNPK